MTYVAWHAGIFGADHCRSQVAFVLKQIFADSCSQPSHALGFWGIGKYGDR